MTDTEALVAAMTPRARSLCRAVDNNNPAATKAILSASSRHELMAIAVILAAHVDEGIIEVRRGIEAEDVQWLAHTGCTPDAAAARLGMKTSTLETWCQRNNADLWRLLRENEPNYDGRRASRRKEDAA